MTSPLPHEPHKIKTVRPIAFPSLAQRKRFLADARFNVGRLTPSQVTYDLCSAGTSAMSQEQLSGQLLGDEAYAGALNFENLVRAVNSVLGHTYVCPTHNLLGSLKLVVATLAKRGGIIPTNAPSFADVLAPRGLHARDVRASLVRPGEQPAFRGRARQPRGRVHPNLRETAYSLRSGLGPRSGSSLARRTSSGPPRTAQQQRSRPQDFGGL